MKSTTAAIRHRAAAAWGYNNSVFINAFEDGHMQLFQAMFFDPRSALEIDNSGQVALHEKFVELNLSQK
jgi:hypothetical protein